MTDDLKFPARGGYSKDHDPVKHMTDRLITKHWAEKLSGQPAVIGIAGPRETGKDTTATRLLPWFRARTEEANITWFADPLYDMVAILTGVPVVKLREQAYKNATWTAETAPIPTLVGKSPRSLLKDIGMWVRDEIDADHWAQHLKQRTSRGVNGWKSWWFVPDTRFVNETKVCDLVLEVRREGVEYAGDHPSEMRLPAHLIDHTVWLTPGMDYDHLGRVLGTLIEARRKARAAKA